jgi:hypothetical protein
MTIPGESSESLPPPELDPLEPPTINLPQRADSVPGQTTVLATYHIRGDFRQHDGNRGASRQAQGVTLFSSFLKKLVWYQSLDRAAVVQVLDAASRN